MSQTTDFYEWLSHIDSDEYTEVYDLYTCVASLENGTLFKASKRAEQIIVTCNYLDDHTLILASEKAHSAFLKFIIDNICNGDDIESYYGYHHAMEKNE